MLLGPEAPSLVFYRDTEKETVFASLPEIPVLKSAKSLSRVFFVFVFVFLILSFSFPALHFLPGLFLSLHS